MKKILAVMFAIMFMLTGCSGDSENNKGYGNIDVKSERIVKEFTGTVNIFHRSSDSLLLSAEEGELFKYYNIDISTAEVRESELTDMADKYIYYEPIGNKGFIVVEDIDYKSTLKYIDIEGSEHVITEDMGPADAINISIGQRTGSVAYTSLLEGSDIWGLYVYSTETFENKKLMNIKSDGLIEGFQYLANWSPDENYIIINDKQIFDAFSGTQKGELKSAFSQWSPTGVKIAFVLEDESGQWLNTEDYHMFQGKKVCVYDVSKGTYEEVFEITEDEYIFGDIIWGGEDGFLAFPGIKAEDTDISDWYMKLNYSSVYIVDLDGNSSKRLETNVDASDGTMIELGNLQFSNRGNLLSFTVGNYERSSLHIVNTTSLEAKAFENTEYLHWIDGEYYLISSEGDAMYFSMVNSIVYIDEKLQEDIIYTSETKLDDFYISEDGAGILIFELQDDAHIARYIGK